jgi:hypothetical protein
VFKHACPTNRTTATVTTPYFDELGRIIHVDIFYTVPPVVASVFLKMSPRVCHVHGVGIVKIEIKFSRGAFYRSTLHDYITMHGTNNIK